MLQKIKAYVAEQNMIVKGDRIVAGVSGGADSVCLFDVLLQLQEEFELSLAVVHVHHGIRKEAQADEDYVRELCGERGVPFYSFHADVARIAQEEHLSEEEAGRQVRYRAFAQVLEEVFGGEGKIAVAHTQNDRAETVLFHLFRGTGVKGLTGIAPVRDRIIRPLLCVQREEVEAYLRERGVAYCQDATNATDAYTRNRIRHHVLSYAQEHICRDAVGHIARAAERLQAASDYLELQVEEAFRETVAATEAGFQMKEVKWRGLHVFLQKELIHKVFGELVESAKDITAVHIQMVSDLFDRQSGRMVQLPYGIVAVRNYEGICIGQNTQACGITTAEEETLSLEGQGGAIRFGGYQMQYRVFENEKGANIMPDIPKNDCTKWFDYDKIKQYPVLRYRRSGDFLNIHAQGGKKTLKQYMIDEKIPREKRAHIPVLAQGEQILWVVGYRMSEDIKISPQTKMIMEIQILGGNEHG